MRSPPITGRDSGQPTPEADSRPSPFRLRGAVAGEERRFSLLLGPNQLGSDPLGHVVIETAEVSRRHALLLVEGSGVEVIDEGSKNGTAVNGRRIERATLSPGDVLTVGKVALTLERVEEEDRRLALTVGPLGRAVSPAESAETDTAPPTPSADRDQPLALIRRVARALGSADGAAGEPAALLAIVEGLGVDGASWLELDRAGEPTILSAVGTLDEAAAAALAHAGHAQTPTDGGWRAGEAAGCTVDAGGTVRALLVCGGDSERLSGELLGVLAELLSARRGPRQAPARRRQKRRQHLRFPADHIAPQSANMLVVYRQLETIARTQLAVLILGETGVGKELLAEILHHSSGRTGPLVAINCASIPANLLEAELFGIGPNVASGVAARRGRFQDAEAGTLLLDEIGDMPLELQAKLLRVLQDGWLEPLGLPRVPIDVRLVAATNADVLGLIEGGRLRRDLYFRLAGQVVEVPPLRHRPEDIPPLVHGFLHCFAQRAEKPIRGVTVRALALLKRYPWPGNVRELRSAIQRLVCACPPHQAIDGALVRQQLTTSPSGAEPLPAWRPGPDSSSLDLEELEEAAIREALRRCGGRQGRACELLGISRHKLRRRMQRYRLGPET